MMNNRQTNGGFATGTMGAAGRQSVETLMKQLTDFNALKSRLTGNNGGFKGEYSIGVYDEGMYLHVVVLAKEEGKIRFVDAERYRLARRLDSLDDGQEFVLEPDGSTAIPDDSMSLGEALDEPDFLSELHNEDEGEKERPKGTPLEEIFARYAHGKFSIGVTLAEPQVHYTTLAGRWQEEGKALEERVIDEIAKERPYMDRIHPDDLHSIQLPDGRVTAIVRDSKLNILNLLEQLKRGALRHLGFIESAEASVVNFIKSNYKFRLEDITTIVYVGHEYSRIVFLKGSLIFHISESIEAFLDSENLANTLYTRILLEQDRMNLPTPKYIFLTGEAYDAGLLDFIKGKFRENIFIDYVNFKRFGLEGMDAVVSRFAVAMGAAVRAIDRDNSELYKVDLTPGYIRENQKRFKLGTAGWVMLVLIPLIAIFGIWEISNQEADLNRLEQNLQEKRTELSALEGIEILVNGKRDELNKYESALNAVDSMKVDLNTWSTQLTHLSSVTRSIGGIWITQMKSLPNGRVLLKGYSLNREKVPAFTEMLNGASLLRVEIQELRNRKVYEFELEMSAKLPREEEQ
ncbi:MAG: hypothetical protein KDI06_17700 [Calditrichaeota bacterium]|nr:hypothetical protein [Calditrichota bacterium]